MENKKRFTLMYITFLFTLISAILFVYFGSKGNIIICIGLLFFIVGLTISYFILVFKYLDGLKQEEETPSLHAPKKIAFLGKDPGQREPTDEVCEYKQEDLCDCGHCYANHKESMGCWVQGCTCKQFSKDEGGE